MIPDFSESGRTSGALQFKRRLPALIAVSVGIALLAFHLLVEPLHVMVMRLIQGVF